MSNEVEGLDQLIAKLRTLANPQMDKVTLAGAMTLEGYIKQDFHGSKTGRVYRRGGKSHVASAPGQTPAIDYGFLLNSVQSKNEGDDAVVFTDDEAAPRLETGSAHMAARPFMRPAVDQHEAQVTAAMASTLKRLVDEAAG